MFQKGLAKLWPFSKYMDDHWHTLEDFKFLYTYFEGGEQGYANLQICAIFWPNPAATIFIQVQTDMLFIMYVPNFKFCFIACFLQQLCQHAKEHRPK